MAQVRQIAAVVGREIVGIGARRSCAGGAYAGKVDAVSRRRDFLLY